MSLRILGRQSFSVLGVLLAVLATGPGLAAQEQVWKHGLIPLLTAEEDEAIELDSTKKGRDSWVSARNEVAGGFRELLPSWNVRVPEGSGIHVALRVGKSKGEPSPWLYVGRWGSDVPNQSLETKFEGGRVATDFFDGAERFDWFQIRIAAHTPETPVHIDRVTVCWSRQEKQRRRNVHGKPKRSHEIDVPFRSQRTERSDIAGRICSPTSVSMVLSYRGVDCTTLEVAQTIYDAEHDIYGNWPRAVQGAYSFGVPGYLTRFSDWREVERLVAAGHPVICSIAVKEGQLRGSPYKKTNGHLIVLRGFDREGNCLVNDPAVADPEKGRLTYFREDMEQVWMARGGTSYVLLPQIESVEEEGAPSAPKRD